MHVIGVQIISISYIELKKKVSLDILGIKYLYKLKNLIIRIILRSDFEHRH